MSDSSELTGTRAETGGWPGQEGLRHLLVTRLDDLRAERERALADLTDMQREGVIQTAGGDQADTGSSTFERDRELALAAGILSRIRQTEHALARMDAGTYGLCERCGQEIPAARLEAFPSVTLCVACKSLEERR
jgi:DnaK suppressor protein